MVQSETEGTDWSRTRIGLLEVMTWIEDGSAVARVVGEIDIYTSRELHAAIAAVQGKANRPGLVILLAGLTFMDSSGLGILVGAYKRAAGGGGRVALVGVRESLLRVLRVTGLSKVLPTFDDADAAFAWVDEQGEA